MSKFPQWVSSTPNVQVRLGADSTNHSFLSEVLGARAVRDGLALYQAWCNGPLLRKKADVLTEMLASGYLPLLTKVGGAPLGTSEKEDVVLVSEHGVVNFDNTHDQCYFNWLVTSKEEHQRLSAFVKTFLGTAPPVGAVHVLVQRDSGLQVEELGIAGVPLSRENYSDEVLEAFEEVASDLNSAEPSGRLTLFDGEPGTGKTFMLRGLTSALTECTVLLVPAESLPALTGAGSIGTLMGLGAKNRRIVILIEDADSCLVARDASNISSVSSLLNITDGILGHVLDIHVVCTTNLRNNELDPAVLRPGRLTRKVHVGKLPPAKASALLRKLLGAKPEPQGDLLGGPPEVIPDLDRPTSLAEVYAMARKRGYKPPRITGKVGFEFSPSTTATLIDSDDVPAELKAILEESQ